ncbi:MAG TPA: PKD domain-containing protein [Chloroflexi bacterium]|nr:PKD domain-containing protein [Chloroflexota bacterium]
MNTKYLKQLGLLFLLTLLATLGTSVSVTGQAGPLVPHIDVHPGTSVAVGEEVLFDATGTTYDDASALQKGRFEWAFGDGYVLKHGEPIYYSMDSGTACTHFYMRPGTYTATLTVSVWDQFTTGGDPVGDPVAVETTTTQITVIGQDPQLPPRPADVPLLEMMLDGDLTDSSPSGLPATWQGGTGGFTRGMAGQAADLTGGAHITVTDTTSVFGGQEELTLSLWARKRATDTYAYLVDKPGQFSLGILGSRTLRATFVTSNGSVRATSYLAYEIDGLQWHHYAATYDGATVRLFLDGRELASEVYSGTLATSTDNLLIGKEADSTDVWDGYVDEVKVYDRALSLEELYTGFELWHAPFQARIAQYIYVQVPGQVHRDATNKLKMTVEGDNAYSTVLVEKSSLAAEEKVLLRNGDLPAGAYTLTAQLLDSGDAVLEEIQETFAKPYDGIPAMGIDENNAICVDGEPFFPVTPWLLNEGYMEDWQTNGYVNTLFAEGWYAEHNVDTWTDYLNAAQSNGLYAIGPERWFGLGLAHIDLDPAWRRHFARNADIGVITDYVSATRDLPALMAWMWLDEPDLGGRGYRVPPPVLSAWTYATHQADPRHPVATNFTGGTWLPYYGTRGYDYDYLNSAAWFGGKKYFSVDISGFDIYPLEYREHPALNDPDRGVMDLYVEAIDRSIAKNYDLVPFMSFVEVCDIDESRQTPGPTHEQVLMEAWLNVVHGIKGINWFHYFEYDTIQYDAMAEFTDQITRLADVVLGPEVDRPVTDSANERGNRVDTMIREHDGAVYVFAVRVTEPEPLDFEEQGYPEPESITVDFAVEGVGSGLAEVFDEGRTVPVTGGTFSDTFAREAVHIYKIEVVPLDLHARPGDETIYLDWKIHVTDTIDSWQINYTSDTGTALMPPLTLTSTARSAVITDVTNGVWYTVTLSGLVDETSWLSDTATTITRSQRSAFRSCACSGAAP